MIIQSKRIGTVDVDESRIIRIDDGLLGFGALKNFFLADDPADEKMPFKWLISLEDPEMMFLVTDPGLFFKDYVFDLSEEEQKFLGAKTPEDLSVITILTVPADPKQITTNLKGPLVINWRTMVGRQLVLKDTAYETKHFIFIQQPAENAGRVQAADPRGMSHRELPTVTAPFGASENDAMAAQGKV